jgi:hypothetical protein
MGHFRIPDLQGKNSDGTGCPNAAPRSIAADDFEETILRKAQLDPEKPTILVGTGDNFAPELEARNFCAPLPSRANRYEGQSKELFAWDGKSWLQNAEIAGQNPKDPGTLLYALAHGTATIPFDNAANFYIQEGYAALVPGKHDFYFGPERLLELGRYLATSPVGNSKMLHGPSVQMLSANLVIETSWKSDHKPVPDNESPPWFIPRFPTVPDLLGIKQEQLKDYGLLDTELKLSQLTDGGAVYPWFQGSDLQVLGADPDGVVAAEINHAKVNVCPSVVTGEPNTLVDPNRTQGTQPCWPVKVERDQQGDGSKFHLSFPNNKAQILLPGENYGLCIDAPKARVSDRHGEHVFCLRFSVYTPFFQYPWINPNKDCSVGTTRCYKNPEPYVVLSATDASGVHNDIVIFGVVDTHLTDYVGTLNLAWQNTQEKKYKTQTAVKDPAEALRELIDYFEVQHPDMKSDVEIDKLTGTIKRRTTKVLLAQMSPQVAQELATRTGRFQVVISAADPELATVGDSIASEGMSSRGKGQFPTVIAIPEPYYVANRGTDTKSPWTVDVGSIEIQPPTSLKGSWRTTSAHLESDFKARESVSAPNQFWLKVSDYLNAHCLESLPQKHLQDHFSIAMALSPTSQESQIQWLAACMVQKEKGADVVLLQKRDFFVDLPYSAEGKADTDQEFLDRLIWKGDFLTLMYVPGSVLLSAMKQSKAYDADDASQTSVSDEKKRGFIVFGMRHDSARDEFLINEIPVDKNRIYSVATSDYIGAGDTGYPDLAANAVRPLLAPQDFDKQLRRISGVVCRGLLGRQLGIRECQEPLNRDDYMDDFVGQPSDINPVDSSWHRIWAWSVFRPSKDVPGVSKLNDVPSQNDRIEQAVEYRRLGSFRINQPNGTLFTLNSSLNFNLANHKFSDAEVSQVFIGNPVPQLSAKRSHAIGYDMQPQLTYSWHRFQLFWNTEERYTIQYTGQAAAPRVVNQKDNLFSSDTGFAFDLPNRAFWHFEAVGSLHYETQIAHPTLATLAPLPKTSSVETPADTARTHYLLPRIGIRFVNRMSWMEIGLEDGTQLQAVRLTPVPPISSNVFQLQRTNIPVSGTYWRWHLIVPFASTVIWTIDEQGDFFFNQHDDSTTDTRFRSDTKTQINFQVFPSLSFAPTYEFFYFSNKVNQDWYWQGQASIQMNVRFDFWNRRRIVDQMKYKIPAQ